MNRRFLALFMLLFVALAVVAAPVNVDGEILEARAKKVAAKPKAVAKPVVKPAAKPVAKPAAKPVAKPAAKPVAKPAAKPVAKPAAKPVAKPAAKPVAKPAAKPVAKPAAKPAAAPKKAAPATSCPIPARKPAARRFLEYIGLARSTPAPACPATGSTSTPTTSTAPLSAADKKAAKAAKAAAKASAAAAAASAAAAAKRPVGTVANAPSKAVQCTDSTGGLTEIPLAAIKTAVSLAQAGPLVAGNNAVKFPHVFNNREGVLVASACAGKTLEEQAVGPDMSTFQNVPSVLKNFNQFRVLITTPDASGDTTFCGVMTHGTSTTGTFEKNLCAEV